MGLRKVVRFGLVVSFLFSGAFSYLLLMPFILHSPYVPGFLPSPIKDTLFQLLQIIPWKPKVPPHETLIPTSHPDILNTKITSFFDQNMIPQVNSSFILRKVQQLPHPPSCFPWFPLPSQLDLEADGLPSEVLSEGQG